MTKNNDTDKKTSSGIYRSQLKASANYDDRHDHIRVRTPLGMKKDVQQYQKTMHKLYPDNPKYKSVNALIVELLKNEIDNK